MRTLIAKTASARKGALDKVRKQLARRIATGSVILLERKTYIEILCQDPESTAVSGILTGAGYYECTYRDPGELRLFDAADDLMAIDVIQNADMHIGVVFHNDNNVKPYCVVVAMPELDTLLGQCPAFQRINNLKGGWHTYYIEGNINTVAAELHQLRHVNIVRFS